MSRRSSPHQSRRSNPLRCPPQSLHRHPLLSPRSFPRRCQRRSLRLSPRRCPPHWSPHLSRLLSRLRSRRPRPRRCPRRCPRLDPRLNRRCSPSRCQRACPTRSRRSCPRRCRRASRRSTPARASARAWKLPGVRSAPIHPAADARSARIPRVIPRSHRRGNRCPIRRRCRHLCPLRRRFRRPRISRRSSSSATGPTTPGIIRPPNYEPPCGAHHSLRDLIHQNANGLRRLGAKSVSFDFTNVCRA